MADERRSRPPRRPGAGSSVGRRAAAIKLEQVLERGPVGDRLPELARAWSAATACRQAKAEAAMLQSMEQRVTLTYALSQAPVGDEDLLEALMRSAPEMRPVVGRNTNAGKTEVTLAMDAVDVNHALNMATAAASEALEELGVRLRPCAAVIERVAR